MRNDRRLVLMVEDDNKLREVLTKFLSRNDYEVLDFRKTGSSIK